MSVAAENGAQTIIKLTENQVMKDGTTQVGNAILGGATGSSYSLYLQSRLPTSGGTMSYINQSQQQSVALSQVANAFTPTNAAQAQALQQVITAFSTH